jgi:tRNA1Val (adenine37-N6)-methyltransferase
MLDRAEVSAGHLLGGRVRYAQPRAGFRTGIEPVLLAAAVPARPGERVLEAGTGAGAALLCLGARVPGIGGVGVERDAMLAALAERNLAANAMGDRFSIVAADFAALPELGAFDHACANPPWHDARSTASPIPAREMAKRAAPGLWGGWVQLLAARLRPRGSLTLILPAGLLAKAMSALDGADCGSAALLPLWPKPGLAAKLILLQAAKGSAGRSRVLPGLTLHQPEGGYTEAAEAILRHGAPLPL